MTLFGTWLRDTAELQRDYYGNDLPLTEGEEFSQEYRVNTLAAIGELVEALQEVPWKPWSKRGSGRPTLTADAAFKSPRDYAVIELVDALHFCANLLLLLRVTDEELNERYEEKMRVNRARMRSGTY